MITVKTKNASVKISLGEKANTLIPKKEVKKTEVIDEPGIVEEAAVVENVEVEKTIPSEPAKIKNPDFSK